MRPSSTRYAALEGSLFGERRSYGAVAPLVGLTAGGAIPLGRGLTVRPVAAGELVATWSDANRLVPRDFGREVDRTLVIELETELEATACRVPEVPIEIARAVAALRLATPGAIAAGPVIFERLDWRPYGVRPVPALAAQTSPRGADASRSLPGQAGRPAPGAARGGLLSTRTCSKHSTAGSWRLPTRGQCARMSCARR